jgi:hypothetical protein
LVSVIHDDSVKLKEGFFGSWDSYFPQYLTKAILLGACHDVLKIIGEAVSEIK